jgi:hypothetical protein
VSPRAQSRRYGGEFGRSSSREFCARKECSARAQCAPKLAPGWPGPRCSPCPAPPAGGSPNGSGCACSPWSAAWPPAVGACGCASPGAGPGPPASPLQSPGCRAFRPADQPERPRRPGRRTPGPAEPRPPSATAGGRHRGCTCTGMAVSTQNTTNCTG